MRRSTLRQSIPFVLSAAAVTALGIADTQFAGLGDLIPGNFVPGNFIPGNFFFLSRGRDVNFDGTVVVGTVATTQFESTFANGRRFRWTAANGMELIPRPDGLANEPTITGVTDDGRTVVGTVDGTQSSPYFVSRMLRQTIGEPARTILTIPIMGSDLNPADDSRGAAISGDGAVIVGSANNPAFLGQRAAVWESTGTSTQGRFLARAVPADPPCLPLSQVNAVSRDGRFAVGSEQQPYEIFQQCVFFDRAVRWSLDGSSLLVLGEDSPYQLAANGVSADGSVIVGQRSLFNPQTLSYVTEMFRWTASGGIVGLGDRPAGGFQSTQGTALDVSADGRVVVGVVGFEAVVWDTTNGLRTVKRALADAGLTVPEGWYLTIAEAVSGDGRVIVGTGYNPRGQIEGWRAELPNVCIADFNGVGGVTIQDVFDFLVAYFATAPAADINGRDGVTVQDVFDYLVAYFAGCA